MIRETRQQIRRLIDDDPDLGTKKALLKTIPGVGAATIAQVLAGFGDITRFRNATALASVIGIAPRQRQSGSSVRGRARMSRIGRRLLRKAFFMPALVALRYTPDVMALKARLTQAGKSKMLIVGAALRRLVHILYGVLKHRSPYVPRPVVRS